MAEAKAYAIVGSGYWAGRMRGILAEQHTVASIASARHQLGESEADYKSRLSESFQASGAQAAWICVPPGPHIPPMTEAALGAGLHVIAEKPWLNARAQTEPLLELAKRRNLLLGVHHQYCLLEAVAAWRRDFNQGADLDFNGCFTVSRPDRLGIDALDNLGSHLIAIRDYAVPKARLREIRCGYEMIDERKVWLERAGRPVASIDFLANRERIIQRFIERAEGAMAGTFFPFGIEFALQVIENVQALKLRQKSERWPGLIV